MKLSIQAGSTSQTVNVFIQDSSSTTGAGLTGLVFNTASLTAYYALPKAAAVSITLATLAAITMAWSSGGFKEVDATNMPGWYRLDIPDAALASGRFVSIHLKGAANMAPLPIEIELTATNNQSATAFITGVNSLAPPTNWNLHSIDASGRVDVIKVAGTTQTARDIGASVLLSSGTGTGQLSLSSGLVSLSGTQTFNVTGSITGNLSGSVGSVTGNVGGSVASVTTVGDKTGYALTSAYDFAKGTVAMTESYAVDGAAMTPVQALHQLWSFAGEKNVASTTVTTKKLDGTTTSMTFTLDSATAPTTITRAT
jgi:hypothetical protein